VEALGLGTISRIKTRPSIALRIGWNFGIWEWFQVLEFEHLEFKKRCIGAS